MLEVLEMMRSVLIYVLEAIEGVRYVLEVLGGVHLCASL